MDASHENMFWSYFTKRKEKKHTHTQREYVFKSLGSVRFIL